MKQDLPGIIENKKDNQLLILIPEGEFLMGSDKRIDGEALDRETPQHSHYLESYYIGIYPVSNRQYKRFVDETGHRPPNVTDFGKPVWQGNMYPKEYGDHPVVCVSWSDAVTYCEWSGLSLPRESEWEKAARGSDGRIYPWGDVWDENRCRNYRNRGSEETCKVWQYAAGKSPYQLLNMSGNIREWCEDWYDRKAYERYAGGDYSLGGSGSFRVLRGGSWGSNAGYCRVAVRGGNFNLLNQCDGRLFLLGFENQGYGGPSLPDGVNKAGLYEISFPSDDFSASPSVTFLDEAHFATGRYCDFDAGVGSYASFTGELLLYCAYHFKTPAGEIFKFSECTENLKI